jgi:hypothetical protein
MKLHRVIVTIYPPREADGYPGEVEEGFYTFEGGSVELVTHARLPRRDRSGKTYAKTLTPGEDPHQIAGRLLKELYQSRREKNRFNWPIIYPRSSIV